jgi:hypothetical protein
MQADKLTPAFLHYTGDLLKGHIGTVIYLTVTSGIIKQSRINKGSRIYDHIGLFYKLHAPKGDKIDRSGTGSDKMYHDSAPNIQKFRQFIISCVTLL